MNRHSTPSHKCGKLKMLRPRCPASSRLAPAGLISGSDERTTQTASSTRIAAMTMYGQWTLEPKACQQAVAIAAASPPP